MNMMPQQFSKIVIPKNKVLARLGIMRGAEDKLAAVGELIDEQISLAEKIITPNQTIAFEQITLKSPDETDIHEAFSIKSVHIYNLLKESFSVYAFAVTIGAHLEEKRDSYIAEKETTRALILDAAGSVAAEELAEMANKEIDRTAEESGFAVTRRFSPGFGDWPLSGQRNLLEWLGAERIGIILTDKFTMVPEKSVSAIIGIIHK